MSLANLLRLWRARLSSRAMLVQEALAVIGIAIGVALLFASQVASTSLSGSVKQLTKEIIGSRQQLQVVARGPNGFSEQLLHEVARLPAVAEASPVLEQPATIVGQRGSQAVLLLGATPRFTIAGGSVLRRLSASQLAHVEAVTVSQAIGERLGANAFEPITVQVGARVQRTVLAATLTKAEIGGLAASPVAVAPLAYAQRLAGMSGRISRVFLRVADGYQQSALRELSAFADKNHLNAVPADFDSRLFDVASNPETQSETLFSVISALVGFLFAFTAILLTVPRRRKHLESLWPHGAGMGITLEILLFDALVLAVLGCTLGLALGDLLSLAAFDHAPGYLASAFPVGNTRIVTFHSIALAVGAGVFSAIGGVLWPMRELFVTTSRRPQRRWASLRLGIAAVCIAVTAVVLVIRPRDAFVGSATLIVALLAVMPTALHLVLAAFDWFQKLPFGGAATELAVDALRSRRVQVRALAIAVLGAVAVFGAVSIGGAQVSLRKGLYASASDVASSAAIWVGPGGEASPLGIAPMWGASPQRKVDLPGVATVGSYRGSFFDWGSRRIWVLAPPFNSTAPIPPSQLLAGSLSRATRRVREGGWVVLSEALAHEHHLAIGDVFTLPSPVPTRLRVAALSTNLGWPPGALILNAEEYARAWGSAAPSAYVVQTASGASPASVRRAIMSSLGAEAGLAVETASERRMRDDAVINQGLSRLTQIKLLVLVASALALAGAMTSLIWQRRERMAAIRVQGYSPAVLWRWLLVESVLILGTGCLVGAAFGVAGQLLLSHALAVVTGFPIALGIEATAIAVSFAWAGTVAFTIVAVPGSLAVQVSPRATSAAQ